MLKPKQIPDEVVRALWEVTGEEPVGVLACLADAKTYLAAAINAWPTAYTVPRGYPATDVVLPLSQKEPEA